MKWKRGLSLMLSAALLWGFGVQGTFAAETVQETPGESANDLPAVAVCEVCGQSGGHADGCTQGMSSALDGGEDNHACTCGEGADEDLARHADACLRKQYVLGLLRNENGGYRSAAQLYADWDGYAEDLRADILHMVEACVPTEYDALALLVSGAAQTPDTADDGVRVSGVPDGVQPEVTDVSPGEAAQEAIDQLGEYTLVFSIDITLKDGQTLWQPEAGELVRVFLDAAQFGLRDGASITIVHEHGESVELLGPVTVENGTLSFETGSFSNFYGYTVDFTYEGAAYSIGGGSDVYLYELFAMLGIARTDDEVADVTVSDPALLAAGKVVADGYTGKTAWLLHSIQAFDTEETITICFCDGSSITVRVTDAHYASWDSGNYTLQDGDTIGPISIPSGATVNLTLAGTVTVIGTISIGAGVTLNVTGSGTFVRGSAFTDKMFYVASGGTLHMEGDSAGSIVIDGGAAFTSTPVADSTRRFLTASGTKATSAAIYVGFAGLPGIAATEGNVKLENVTMQNLYSSVQAPAIHVTGATDSLHSTVTLRDVTIQNCATTGGNAIVLLNDCVATMGCCKILGNYSGGTYAGAVKAGGPSWFSQLTMTACSASGNYSAGWGGVVLWAANNTCGEKSSKAVIDRCDFHDNLARWLGGAVSNEAIMEVKNTTITKNTAMAGGGIATFPFTLTESSTGGGNACGLTLGSGNTISENTACAAGSFTPYSKQDADSADGDDVPPIGNQITYTGGGGGVWCYMNKEKWSCSLDIGAGNTIASNASGNVGGGVYVEKVAGVATTLSITGASVSGNRAVDGGGVAVREADVAVSSGDIQTNTASRNGGGIFVANGSATVTGSGSVRGNTAANGGGLYIADGTINVNGGIISLNRASGSYDGETTQTDADALAGVGGGVFLKAGKFTLSGSNIGIYNNTATVAANDVYASGSGTTLELPEVKNMNLTGMAGEEKPTGWYADYKPGDTAYPPSVIGSANPGRYAAGADGNVEVAYEKLTNNATTFYCLTLGLSHTGYGTLKITKTGVDARDHDGTSTIQSSLFHIVGKTAGGDEISIYVTIAGNDSVTICALPAGRYTVTELTAWTWRYDESSRICYPDGGTGNEEEITISAQQPDWNADFVNTRKRPLHLSGDSRCENWWRDDGVVIRRREND